MRATTRRRWTRRDVAGVARLSFARLPSTCVLLVERGLQRTVMREQTKPCAASGNNKGLW